MLSNLLYVVESEPQSVNFQQAGYDSSLLLTNLGSMFFIMIAYVGLYVIFLFVVWPLTKLCPKIQKVTNKLRDFLFWGGTMRFFIESYMQICICTMLNLKEYEWEGSITLIALSDVLAIIAFVVVTVLPIALLIFFACNISRWDEERFAERHGAFLEGADLDREHTQWIVLLIPLTYFLRRLLMSATLVFWIDFFWG